MGFDGLPSFVVQYLLRIAHEEGFSEEYDVKHESGSKTGDGFMSSLLSIKLVGLRRQKASSKLELDELALICKLPPNNVTRQENFVSERIFRQEVYVYNNVLPTLTAFQEECKFPREYLFTCFPKCYVAFHEDGNSASLIILEDLRAAGFEMWDRTKPTNFEGSRLLMEQIGRLHGLSIAIREQKPDVFQKLRDLPPIIFEYASSQGIASVVESSIERTISLAENSQDMEIIERLVKNWKQNLKDGVDAKLLGKYGVLSHGDCWINNMMFKMEKGIPKSINLVDWQICRVTSIAIDLSFYLFTSTEKSLRDVHIDEFLNIYYTNLARTIRLSGSDPEVLFPEVELQRQLCQFGVYGAMLAPTVIPLIIADTSEIPDFDDMAAAVAEGSKDIGPVKNLNDINTKKYYHRMKDVLDDARRYGWLK